MTPWYVSRGKLTPFTVQGADGGCRGVGVDGGCGAEVKCWVRKGDVGRACRRRDVVSGVVGRSECWDNACGRRSSGAGCGGAFEGEFISGRGGSGG